MGDYLYHHGFKETPKQAAQRALRGFRAKAAVRRAVFYQGRRVRTAQLSSYGRLWVTFADGGNALVLDPAGELVDVAGRPIAAGVRRPVIAAGEGAADA